VAAIGRALDHLDPVVRACAVATLCEIDEPEAKKAVIRAMDHWDPATRRVAAAELGRHRIDEAVEPLVKVLWKREMFERNYELRKQCIESLVEIGSPRSLPGLRRMAAWRFVIDRRGRELRFLACQAVAELEAGSTARHEGKA
jgi:HEAT repeat protein